MYAYLCVLSVTKPGCIQRFNTMTFCILLYRPIPVRHYCHTDRGTLPPQLIVYMYACYWPDVCYSQHAAPHCVILINSSCRTAGVRCHTHSSALALGIGRMGVAASCSVQHTSYQTLFSLYLGEGVTPRPKFCTPIALQKRSTQAKKQKKICIHCLYQAPVFVNFGGPYLRMFSACFQAEKFGAIPPTDPDDISKSTPVFWANFRISGAKKLGADPSPVRCALASVGQPLPTVKFLGGNAP